MKIPSARTLPCSTSPTPALISFTATTLGAIGTSLAIAAVWDLDLVTFLIMGVVIAASLIAGRGLGSMLRTRRVELISRPPGLLASLDGLVLAAAVFLPVLRLVA